MSVAVVIPAKNSSRFIEQTLRSVLWQTRRPDQIIVVDDGSDDDTVERARAFDPSVLVIGNAGSGSNTARATGIASSDSKFVALLDHDDVWFPHHLEILVGLLEATPEAVAAYSGLQMFSDHLEIPPATDEEPELVDLWVTFPHNRVGGPSSVVVRREALDAVGGWPRWNRVPTDVYMWFLLADVGPFAHWPARTAGWRRHPSSMSHTMMRSDPGGYTQRRADLLADVLRRRIETNGGHQETGEAQLRQFDAISDLIGVMVDGDADRLPIVVERIASTPELPDHLATYFRAFYSGALDGRRDRLSTGVRLRHAWPRHHRRLRRALVDPAIAKEAMAGTRAHPFRPSRWSLPPWPELRHVMAPVIAKVGRGVVRRLHRALRR